MTEGMATKPEGRQYEACIVIRALVQFIDDGENALRDQAINALEDGPWPSVSSLLADSDYQIEGAVTEVQP